MALLLFVVLFIHREDFKCGPLKTSNYMIYTINTGQKKIVLTTEHAAQAMCRCNEFLVGMDC